MPPLHRERVQKQAATPKNSNKQNARARKRAPFVKKATRVSSSLISPSPPTHHTSSSSAAIMSQPHPTVAKSAFPSVAPTPTKGKPVPGGSKKPNPPPAPKKPAVARKLTFNGDAEPKKALVFHADETSSSSSSDDEKEDVGSESSSDEGSVDQNVPESAAPVRQRMPVQPPSYTNNNLFVAKLSTESGEQKFSTPPTKFLDGINNFINRSPTDPPQKGEYSITNPRRVNTLTRLCKGTASHKLRVAQAGSFRAKCSKLPQQAQMTHNEAAVINTNRVAGQVELTSTMPLFNEFLSLPVKVIEEKVNADPIFRQKTAELGIASITDCSVSSFLNHGIRVAMAKQQAEYSQFWAMEEDTDAKKDESVPAKKRKRQDADEKPSAAAPPPVAKKTKTAKSKITK